MEGFRFESVEGGVTQEQFARFVEERERIGDIYHYELLNGRVVMNPPAGFPHGSIDSNLQVLFGNFVKERKLGQVFGSRQGFDLPSGDTVEPDASFVSNERWSAITPKMGAFLPLVPDLVVEVLSKKTAAADRGEKKAIYERNGVREYWLIDPRQRSLTVFNSSDGRFDGGQTFAESDRCSSRVLEGLSLLVGSLFP